MVCAVVGFPLGAMTPTAKAFEAREAVRCGADEIDMVINIGALKSRDYALVEDDIRQAWCRRRGRRKVKVILETGALTAEEKIIGCTLSKIAGAALRQDLDGVRPRRRHRPRTSRSCGAWSATSMGVKASGGVRTHEDAEKMRAAGADRIGASASVAIVGGADAPKQQAKGY